MAPYKIRDIEDEKNDVPEELNQPFNPKDIDITVEPRSLDSIISRMRYEEVDMNTHFQRKGDLWSDAVMSRLIESILIRFPLPAFYFDASDDENWLIVDGLQRLSAIRKFVLNCDDNYVRRNYSEDEIRQNRHTPLKLTGLEYFQEYNGLTFDRLPPTMKRRLNEAQVTVYLIKPGTPEEVKYSVFYRINTGGLQLNAQEIRHALNQKGISATLLEEMANNSLFKKVVKISDKRMQDRELVLRYIAFFIHHYSNYKPSMLRFLNNVMKEINSFEGNSKKLELLKENFIKALNVSYEIFGESAFSKSLNRMGAKNTLNRGLFETWSVLLAKLDEAETNRLLKNKEELLDDFKNILADPSFDKAISSSTTGAAQVEYRFKVIEKLIQTYI